MSKQVPNTTFIIKSFMRKACLQRLLASIVAYYPNQKVIVLDDSKRRLLTSFEVRRTGLDLKYIHTHHDIGLSEGRNRLVSMVKTDYFLLLDDDFILDSRSNVAGALEALQEYNADIVGGNCFDLHHKEGIVKRDFVGNFRKAGNELYCSKIQGRSKVTKCDFVLNFFVARTTKVLAVKWDPELKILEHIEFFWRAKLAGLQVFHLNTFYVLHYAVKTSRYRRFRVEPVEKYRKLQLAKLGVDRLILPCADIR